MRLELGYGLNYDHTTDLITVCFSLQVLNEVVVDRGPSPYICNIDLYIEHKYITSVQGDG